ncbi:MFS transporter [Catenulispora sp. NF23]|uniref:MFS transporter n=1 Tax=Catenulispora pinistramenti TaxID=2705254 RepID=A0ABS5KP72_9ACTN|nr:MFS transporter [Catenulispora pinistramenti]MBS2532731.1 MFS transporter [Catenulispora pinistramenti]MBS2547852.1 MFS transporter [Catenulispora pinistramenti]
MSVEAKGRSPGSPGSVRGARPPAVFPARLGAAVLADGIGTGMFMPFSVLYFVHVVGLPLSDVGGCLTAAGLLALPASMLTGSLVDRRGSLPFVVGGDLLGAAAFIAYLWVRSAWELVLVAFVAALGQATVRTAGTALIAAMAEPGQRAVWLARQSAARNAGYGVGVLAGTSLVVLGSHTAYLLLAGINAASYLVAAVLLGRLPGAGTSAGPPPGIPSATEEEPSYGSVLRDRRLRLLSLAGLGLVVCMNVLPVLLTTYLTAVLGHWVFLGGLAIAGNTVIVVAAQAALTRRVQRFPEVRVVQAAAAAWSLGFLCLWILSAVPWWGAALGLLAAVASLTLAEMLYGPTVGALAAQLAPVRARGRHLGVFYLSWSLGSAIAPAVLTWLLSEGHQWPWIVLIAVCAASATALGRIQERTAPLTT